MMDIVQKAVEKGFAEGYQKALADLLMDVLHEEALKLDAERSRNK